MSVDGAEIVRRIETIDEIEYFRGIHVDDLARIPAFSSIRAQWQNYLPLQFLYLLYNLLIQKIFVSLHCFPIYALELGI